jgi:oxygen-dependent protoporphyrinogen oxidase
VKHVVIIGGGVAGLGAAYKLKRARDAGHDVTFDLYEKDDRLGGKIRTEQVEGFVLDGGPDCFLTQKPAVHRIAKMLGISERLLPSDESRKRTLILAGGGLHDLPDGVMMFAPTKFLPFATTGLFTWPGKIRMAMDLVIPKKRRPGDETLDSFVRRRMGHECLDRLAEPLVGGVHASDPDLMSLEATFPNLLDMEQKHGSLIKGFVATRRKVAEMKKKHPPKPGRPRTFFTSFKGGMQELTDALADAAGRESIHAGMAVERLERDGDAWKVTLADGSTTSADGVIVATEAWAAAELVGPLDAEVEDALENIPHSSSATVSMAFDMKDVKIDTDAFGLLCPLVEDRSIMAGTYSSTKWPGRAPKGRFLARGFVGGPHNQEILEKSDEELVEIVHAEFADILGLDAEPLFARVYRWEKGMPQYTLGHIGRVELVQDRVGEMRGLAVAGGSYTGVGVPNCIESGEAAVTKVLADGRIELAEDVEAAERARAPR